MTKWAKIVCCFVAPLGLLFCMVGYAALSTTLTIQGTAQAEMPDAVYIAEIISVSYQNNARAADDSGAPVAVDFPSTKFLSNIYFPARKSSGWESIESSVTVTVRIANGTSKPQIFNKVLRHESMEGFDGTFTYNGITESGASNPNVEPGQGTVIPSKGSCVFTVTITNKTRYNYTNRMLFEFDFVTDTSELTQKASTDILDVYDALLNSHEGKEGVYADMQKLMSWGAGNGNEGYISNSPGFSEAQKNAVNNAFGDVMHLEHEGEEYDVTVLLKQQSVCTWNDPSTWNKTEERAIYFTADPLQDPGARVSVFVCVFYESEGEWIPVGQQFMSADGKQKYWILEGTATVCGPAGEADGKGNFQTGDWRSSKEYFDVPAGATLQTLMDQCDPD